MRQALRRVWEALALNGFWVPLHFQDTALPAITIPAAVAVLAPRDHIRALSLVLASMSLLAMIVPPLAGALSDRLRARGLPRRVLIWSGAGLDMAALVLLANVHSLALFVVLVLVATMGANISLAAYQAMIPDVVPQESWGAASGVRNIATLLGVILGFAVAAGTTVATTFIGVAVALGVFAVVLLAQRENALPNVREERAHVSDWHDFSVVFIARLFLAFGLALLMTFVLYFFRDILHAGNPSAGTAYVGFASLAGAIISGIYLGWLSDRVSRKIVVALCGIPMTVAAAGFATFPNEHWMYGFAVLFGVGFGGIMSTGWALAIDSVPKLRDVARDLGIWGIAQNAPQVIAPLAGGAVLAAFGNGEAGYQTLFYGAAVCFALGSVTVLGVGARPIVPWWGSPLRIAASIAVWSFLHLQNRMRSWGALPRERGPALVISNHQIDLDLMEPLAVFILGSARSCPVLAVSARLMYEPGFMTMRVPRLRALLGNANFGWLFAGLGLLPLENELQSRSIARWAFAVQRRHGITPLRDVFKAPLLAAAGLHDATTADLLRSPLCAKGHTVQARLSDLQTAYRKEAFDEMRSGVEGDLQRIESAIDRGATFYLTPEGEYPVDGKMLPFRGIWQRVEPHAREIYLCAISYDPLRTGKFSQLYRVVPLRNRTRAQDELKKARPVTVSAVLADWLVTVEGPFTFEDVLAAVQARLRGLPDGLFVDPELSRNIRGCVRDALNALVRLKIARRARAEYRLNAVRRHPRFAHTPDILAQQSAFHRETLAAASSREASCPAG
ncbi:MAG: MFS transporter [Candidatus Baltobacteraceae bacterium]